ncbi:MAG TPA: hypothetical protein VIM58_04020 [Candidatus Methylacidiphilales bacterium]
MPPGPGRLVAPPPRVAGATAFTLLEICIALAIVAVVIGLCAPSFSSWLGEERLREPARNMELLARTARNRAIDTQKSWAVVVRPEELSLVLDDGQILDDDRRDANPDLSFPVADGIAVATKGWNDADYATLPEVRWVFRPNGLCEPLSIRFTKDESMIGLRFDPLTGDVAEETYAFH